MAKNRPFAEDGNLTEVEVEIDHPAIRK